MAPEVQDVETMFEEEADPPNQHFEVVGDKEEDRTTDDELLGRHIKALCENWWFLGEMNLNTSLTEYKVVFTDDTIDFISINDLVDNVEIVLMEEFSHVKIFFYL